MILTNEEIKAIDPDGLVEGFARAIEAAVLEKLKQQEPVSFEAREIGEGDWFKVGLDETERIEAYTKLPHMDYRWLYAHPMPAVPDGWKLVPVEPTEEMILGFWGEIRHGEPEIAAAKDAYRAMLSAAPEAPAMPDLVKQRDDLLAALEGAANYIDNLGGTSQGYRQAIAAVRGAA